MGIFDFRNPSKRKKRGNEVSIQCDPKEILVNTTVISFPTTYEVLKTVFGEASRIEPITQTKNKVYLWDDLGIYCSSDNPEKMLMLLLVLDNRYGLGHQPTKNFTGNVLIDGQDIDISLKNVGTDRPYIIRSIIKETTQVAIALGWNPGI